MRARNTKPAVSIITSYFRGERYLKGFLSNLESQDLFPNLQLVMDANEPTENEIKILTDFEKLHPGVLNLSINKVVVPMSVSLNNCLKRAESDYVCIWNVDDLRTNNSVSSQLFMLKTDSSISTVYGPFKIVSEYQQKDGRLVDNSNFEDSQFVRKMLLGPFFMFRKEITHKIGMFDEQFHSAADFDFAIRLALVGKCVSTNNLLGYFLDENLGLSTRENSIGPIERSVIQLRYGVLGMFNVTHLHGIHKYAISLLKSGEDWYPLSELIENYEDLGTKEIDKAPKMHRSLSSTIKIFSRLLMDKLKLN